MTLRTIVLMAAGAVLFVTSCSSSAPKNTQTVGAVLQAATKAVAGRPATISGDIDLAGRRTKLTGGFVGDVPTGLGSVAFHVPVAGGFGPQVELRWTSGNLYVDRAVVTAPGTADARLVRTIKELRWSKRVLGTTLVSTLPNAFDPPALLRALAQEPVGVTMSKNQMLNGRPTTVIRAASIVVLGMWTNAAVTVWLDASSRPVRVEVRGRDGGAAYDVAYGSHFAVSAPPANQIETGVPARFVVTGPYRVVRSGAAPGVTWSVLKAPATNGFTCWKWQATPRSVPLITDTADGARCVPTASPSADPADQVQFVFEPKTTGLYDAFVAVVPPGLRAARIGRVGGAVTKLTDLGAPLVVVGPAQPAPAYLELGYPSGTVTCGRGAVSVVGDLQDDLLTQHVVGSPWTC